MFDLGPDQRLGLLDRAIGFVQNAAFIEFLVGAATVALLVRQWSTVFRYAVATLRADTDPAAALKGAIQRPKVQHHKPLTREQIAEFSKVLECGAIRWLQSYGNRASSDAAYIRSHLRAPQGGVA